MRAAFARSPSLRAAALAFVVAGTFAACGLRTPVRPPEATAPIVPGAVTATHDGDVIVVRWKRADRSADGQHLDDLAAFVVERKRGNEDVWQRVATIDVVDQEKIRRRHDFSWRDTDVTAAQTSYRVLAVCADGQEGPPTEAALATAEPAPVSR